MVAGALKIGHTYIFKVEFRSHFTEWGSRILGGLHGASDQCWSYFLEELDSGILDETIGEKNSWILDELENVDAAVR